MARPYGYGTCRLLSEGGLGGISHGGLRLRQLGGLYHAGDGIMLSKLNFSSSDRKAARIAFCPK